MKLLPHKNDFRIQNKSIVHWTGNKQTENFEPTTSDREIMLAILTISYKFSSFTSNRKDIVFQTALYFVNSLDIINVNNAK